MYDRTMYDRTNFDRSSGFLSLEQTFVGTGALDCKILWIIPSPDFTLSGEGKMPITELIVPTPTGFISTDGEGDLKTDRFDLPLWLENLLSGEGDLTTYSVQGVTLKASPGGEGDLYGSDLDLPIEVDDFAVSGEGNLKTTIVFEQNLSFESNIDLSGEGALETLIEFPLELKPTIGGEGSLTAIIDTVRFIMGVFLDGEGSVLKPDMYFPLYLKDDHAIWFRSEGALKTDAVFQIANKTKITGAGDLSSGLVLERKLSLQTPLNGEGSLISLAEFKIPIPKTAIPGEGRITTDIFVNQIMNAKRIDGIGNITLKPLIQAALSAKLSGEGNLIDKGLRLGRTLAKFKLAGEGALNPELTFRIPIAKTKIQGEGALVDSGIYRNLILLPKVIQGEGNVTAKNLRFIQQLALARVLNGEGNLTGVILKRTNFSAKIGGEGNATMNVFTKDVDTITLTGVNLGPGQTLVIDTDTYDIWKNGALDLTSVSSDSVFFQLYPGINEIMIDADVSTMKVNIEAIVENRWL